MLAVAAIAGGSVALAAFGVDSLIENLVAAVVIWQLKGEEALTANAGLGIIAVAFTLLAAYIAVQSAITPTSGTHPGHSTLDIVWLAATVPAMFTLAAGKRDTGRGPTDARGRRPRFPAHLRREH